MIVNLFMNFSAMKTTVKVKLRSILDKETENVYVPFSKKMKQGHA